MRSGMFPDEICCCVCIFHVITGAIVVAGAVICFTVDFKLGLYIILGVSPFPYLCSCFSEFYASAQKPNPLVWCSCAFKLVGTVLGILGILALIRSADKKDNRVGFHAGGPTLTQFSLTNNLTTLSYDLSLNVTVGPNQKGAGVCFEKMQAWGNYQGNNFTSLSLPPFFLGGKKNRSSNSSTVVLQSLEFRGRRDGVVLVGDGLKRYQQEAAAGKFTIDVTLSFLGFRTRNVSDCDLGGGGGGNGTLVDKAPAVGHHQVKGVATLELKAIPLTPHNGTA